jgi:hypothetical protein
VGVLDIFGFENFKNNSFEQVCINLAHEQLQYFFNRHTFEIELQEYAKEGIDVKAITFKDNLALVEMFMGKNPPGILALLDEECSFPKATDSSFVDKCEKHFIEHESYVKPETGRGYVIASFSPPFACCRWSCSMDMLLSSSLISVRVVVVTAVAVAVVVQYNSGCRAILVVVGVGLVTTLVVLRADGTSLSP